MEWLKRIGCHWLQFTVTHGYCLLLSILGHVLGLIKKLVQWQSYDLLNYRELATKTCMGAATAPKMLDIELARSILGLWDDYAMDLRGFSLFIYMLMKRLFHMINGLPTIYEVVTGTSRKQSKERTNNSSKSNKSGLKNSRQSESYTKASKMPPPKEGAGSEGEDNEDMEEHGNTLCGACGDNYANDEFWICCDVCEKWYHGKCVKITPARAEHIKQYKCPGCSTKRARA
ncbi:PHD finger protein ALFIN-LIKE 8 isoform X3 [Musa acuminata AAA Group]|uniref:PHD finger protein ALFIN-LIKE 8 isoform X3 n=1 Tax=Musa acuminata AAA Group TaxID=214697 RepID=UPI0031D00909